MTRARQGSKRSWRVRARALSWRVAASFVISFVTFARMPVTTADRYLGWTAEDLAADVDTTNALVYVPDGMSETMSALR